MSETNQNPVQQPKRKRILSGIQPTGTPTLGNYVGAVRNWALLQKDYDCLYMVADLHSLTVREEPAALRRRTREAGRPAAGRRIDPVNSVLFVQSHVPAHTQLAWVLACNTQYGQLTRMTQFKDKSAKHPDNVNGGLFHLPVLMAADIQIYNADLVPVGDDQTQHLEITRDIAQRFNNIYGAHLHPAGRLCAQAGARIMSLVEPTKKMSKSDPNVNSFVLMTDDRDTIVRKFKRAVTDSEGTVRYDVENKPASPTDVHLLHLHRQVHGRDRGRSLPARATATSRWPVAETVADALTHIAPSMTASWPTRPMWMGYCRTGAASCSPPGRPDGGQVYRKIA